MAVQANVWLDLVQREYLRRFVPGGGSAIKFVVGEEIVLDKVRRQIESSARDRRLHFVSISASTTKLHLIQDVFFAIARMIEWDVLAQRWVEAIFRNYEYKWPRPNQAVPIQEIAVANGVSHTLLNRTVQQWLTKHIMHDREMAQDFRSAMTHLCMRRMEMADVRADAPVIDWLRGELRTIGAVRQVPINAKITRHNGRAMLRSLCHWLRLSGAPGLAVAIDLRQIGRTGPSVGEGVRYSAAAVLDVFEVLRQLIDDADSFKGLFVVVLADPAFNEDDPRRSVGAYTALKERIWADVHARGHENPLAPLLQLSDEESAGRSASEPGDSGEMSFVPERVAVEALRAGVPNRAAIRLLGTSETALCDRFMEQLHRSRTEALADRLVEGQIIAGGFGTGKSHLLGYLADQALRENFIVSAVTISKETPLFDPQRLFATAMRNAIVPGVNDDVMTAVLQRLLDVSSCDDLEKWASEAQLPLFAALLFLLPKQVIATEDIAAIARFFAGGRLSLSKVRQWLRAAGALRLFDIKPAKAADLALQRLRFTPHLFAAAGYAGWCVLLDEVELIGRYSTLQRGKSYAELCRWLGLAPDVGIPGVVAVCAITDDFKDVMLNNRLDQEKVPRVLDAKGLERQGRLAEIGMSAIERRQHFLTSPDEHRLRQSLGRVRELYEQGYGWKPNDNDIGERRTGKTVRQFIKSWITDWDIQRIYGMKEQITTETLEPDYTENKDLEHAPLETADEELE